MEVKRRTSVALILLCRGQDGVRETTAQFVRELGGDDERVEVFLVLCGFQRKSLRAEGRVFLKTCKVLRVHARYNRAVAINAAVSLAQSKTIVIVEQGCEVSRKTLLSLSREATKGYVVTIKDIRADSSTAVKRRSYELEELAYAIKLKLPGRKPAEVETQRINLKRRSNVGVSPISTTRSAFVAVGGMNSDLGSSEWEDIDLLLRIQLALGVRHKKVGRALARAVSNEASDLDQNRMMRDYSKGFKAALANYAKGNLDGTFARDKAITKNIKR